jgi:hypothetical protein
LAALGVFAVGSVLPPTPSTSELPEAVFEVDTDAERIERIQAYIRKHF